MQVWGFLYSKKLMLSEKASSFDRAATVGEPHPPGSTPFGCDDGFVMICDDFGYNGMKILKRPMECFEDRSKHDWSGT